MCEDQKILMAYLYGLIGCNIIRRKTKLAALVLATGTAERTVEGAVGEER